MVERILLARTCAKIVIDEFGLFSWIQNISSFINGPLVEPFSSLLQACTQYLLDIEDKQGTLTRRLCNVARLESAFIRSFSKTPNFKKLAAN